ncbi:extracellular solute-binding protein [Catenulispora subtropica]|uniref:Extracellular solute-binding protein n=1 Tax=Catenulispora subtropica TaxID=450798 RepID=A0ABP5DUL0_9ACTN
MRIRIPAGLAAGIVLALGATACSSSTSSGPTGTSTPASGGNAGKTLTVWYMDGDLSDAAVKAINDKFTALTGAQVKVQIQQWDGINTKVATALAQDNPPDVLEIGNTDVPLFAASGGLSDITSALPDLQAGGQHWLPGLEGPATVGGKSFGAPLFAGNRAVIYNKKIWAAAGITAPPTTFAQLTADLDAVKAKNTAPDFSAFYFPGKYWHGALQFVWDAGGQLAAQSGGKWTGTLESAEAQKGLTAWKDFVGKYSSAASRDVETTAPDFNTLFAQGKAGAILNSSINSILKVGPSLKDQIGTFPFPSATDGRTQPVFLGGSDLAIAAKSKNQSLALAYLKAATDPAVQASAIVGIDHWIPASTEVIDQTIGSLPATSQAFFTAAKTSVPTPAVAGWATVESDKSIDDFFADIATGRKSPAEAAKSLDAHLDQALNAPVS